MSERKLDEEFPSLLSIQKKAPSSPQSSQQKSASTPIPKKPPPDFDIKSTESIMKTNVTQQDFCHALLSSMNLIPDPPYERNQDKSNPNPKSYPRDPCLRLTQPEFFKKHDIQTLFFIFFYYPGTTQQYFAAQELKNRHWIYHLKYQTWFHRLSNPTEKTDTYVIAEYEYFDHSTSEGWCIRKRPNFKLELENTEK